MKKFIVINQYQIVRSGLHKRTDLIDWAIIDYIASWEKSKKKKTVIYKDKIYTWLNYQHLIKSLPLLGIKTKSAITKRLKKLKKLGLIYVYQLKSKEIYVSLTELTKSILECFLQETEVFPVGNRTCFPRETNIKYNQYNKSTYKVWDTKIEKVESILKNLLEGNKKH
jgi:DNA-binding MarR family transcriptional regulator